MLHIRRSIYTKTLIRPLLSPKRRLFNTTPGSKNSKEKKLSPKVWLSQYLSDTNKGNKEGDEKPNKEDAFLSSLFTNSEWLQNKIESLDLPSVDDITVKMTEVYPEFASQVTHLKEGYQKMWDFLTMEEFRKLIEEVKNEGTDAELFPEINKDAFVRVGNDLSDEEKAYIKKRKEYQKRSFAKFIHENPDHIHENDIPVIGLASSGGGYRAMIGLSGYLNAIKKTGVMDTVMYFAGISGSCWTMAMYYHPLSRGHTEGLKNHLKSHVNRHWANVSNLVDTLTASPEDAKLLLQGAIRRYHQLNGNVSLVDVFGVLIGSSLLSRVDNDHITDRKKMYLSRQRELIDDGSEPMPIYSVVHHDCMQVNKEGEGEDNKERMDDVYQWFEFTPYDMGCDELGAWIPVWSFGRRFEHGKCQERTPEPSIEVLMGMFGSAFAASLINFYQEMRHFLPSTALQTMDDIIKRYEESMTYFHPISPATFANPFYKLYAPKDALEMSDINTSKNLSLMDAGMDNNIPFYPLLRDEREVDVILVVDLSADIQHAPHFDKAQSYIKRRGIRGWPEGAGWPKEPVEKDEDVYSLDTCNLFVTRSAVDPTEESIEHNHRNLSIVYLPYIKNKSYDPDFDPQKEAFCKTWNFVYTPEQVDQLIELGEYNWNENIDMIRDILRKAWVNKRDLRLKTLKA